MNLDFINVPTKNFGGEPYAGQLGASFMFDYRAKIDFDKMVLCVSLPKEKQP